MKLVAEVAKLELCLQRNFLKDFLGDGKCSRGWLGFTLKSYSEEQAFIFY